MSEPKVTGAEEYSASRRRIREVLDGADDATVVPACPAWTAHDLVAHLAGLATALSTGQLPGSDLQAWVDAMVVDRRAQSTEAVLDEWDRSGPAFEAMIAEQPRAWGSLLFDVVVHEHDLRGALGRPGARDAEGVLLSVDVGVALFDGHVRADGLGPVELRVGDRRWLAGEGEPALELELDDAWELLRSIGGRRSRAQLALLPWRGDVAPYFDSFHLPPPDDDIVE